MPKFDFRSDTVTQPTEAMREAMATAEVGDDVYGEDPSVNKLQEMAAERMGMEAGIFVPTGTMGNLAAILSHCQRGDEIIVGNKAHIFLYEAGGMAALGGVMPHTLENQTDGTLKLADIENAIRPDDPHFTTTRLITLENTHNRCDGAALSVDYVKAVADIAHDNGLKFHIDGARIFNAAVSLGIPVKELTSPADSVTFCLSKGLSVPLGSVLCGSEAFIAKAHRARKQLGGGMRQAGIIAAAGIIALEEMVDRMSEDHRRARQLSEGLAQIEGLVVNPEQQQTNMVYFELGEDLPIEVPAFITALKNKGVLLGGTGGRRFRMVTHAWITDNAITESIETIKKAVNL